MGILKDKLTAEENRPQVIKDCAVLVDDEVASKKGVTGIMIKGGYKAFKAIKPSIVSDAVGILLDDFAKVLDGYYDTYIEAQPDKTRPFDDWARLRDKEIANGLLTITDDIMARSNKTAIKKVYKSLRKVAERQVSDAVPGIGKLVVKHMG